MADRRIATDGTAPSHGARPDADGGRRGADAPGASRLVAIGRTFFAVALVGLGIEHMIFGEFVTGRAPAWPASLAGRVVWAYATGIAFVAVGFALIARWHVRYAAALAASLIFTWALLRHIPVIAADSPLAPSWTNAGKALAFFGGVLAIAGASPPAHPRAMPRVLGVLDRTGELVVLGRVCLGIFLSITGIQHFMFTPFVASLIPGWFPGDAVAWTYFAGVALIAGGVGLVFPPTARLAALLSGLMVFSWFFIVHIPRTFLNTSSAIAVFEALAVSGIAFVLAGYRDARRPRIGRRPAGSDAPHGRPARAGAAAVH